jgi:protein-S-isoprenylcysteine O-methyltransferase Ste14
VLWLLAPLGLTLLITALHRVLPARDVEGYVTDGRGVKLRYRLNGLLVFFVSVALWALACHGGLLPWDAFFVHRWELATGACVFGLVASAALVLPATPVRGLLADLFLGRLANPQWQGIDAKMALYLVGATILELNLLSFAAFHRAAHPDDPSPGVVLYVALFTFFLCEYLFFEEVHLYTYDFMAERVGFKLGWGCLVFYPYFYGVGLWTTAELPNPRTPTPLLALFAAVFFAGWVLSRGANLQKFTFKRDPAAKAFGLLDPRPLSANGRHVLTGGFWGLSRHINYLGEVLMACGLALSLGHFTQPGPWLYPLYYVALLVPRQLDDDRRCAEKYGPLWAEYQRRVPWRIVPFVY